MRTFRTWRRHAARMRTLWRGCCVSDRQGLFKSLSGRFALNEPSGTVTEVGARDDLNGFGGRMVLVEHSADGGADRAAAYHESWRSIGRSEAHPELAAQSIADGPRAWDAKRRIL